MSMSINAGDTQSYLSKYTDDYWSKVINAYQFGQMEYNNGLPKVKGLFNSIMPSLATNVDLNQLTNLIHNCCLYVAASIFAERNIQLPVECSNAYSLINNMISQINQRLAQQQMMQQQRQPVYNNGNVFGGAGQQNIFPLNQNNNVGATPDVLPHYSTGTINVDQSNFIPQQPQAGISTTLNATTPIEVVVDRTTPLLLDGIATFNYSNSLLSANDIETRLNSSDAIDSMEDLLSKFKDESSINATLTTTFESTLIYPSDPKRLDDLIKMLTSLSEYTSLYQWLLEVTKFKDASIINLINNRLNQLISTELKNRTGETLPFQQIFYKWDNFMELVRSMKMEWVLPILLNEVLLYSNNVKLLSIADKTVMTIVRPTPILILNIYLTFFQKKKELVATGFSEESFYVLYHKIFSDLNGKYATSSCKVVDRSMLMFKVHELGQHLLTPAKNYSVDMLEAVW